MATGALDANGIWQYGEDDSETTFSALLNKLGGSTSTTVTRLEEMGGITSTQAATARDNLGVGIVPISPSSVVIASGSGSANTLGQVSFTSATSVSLNGVFTSAYKNYRLTLNIVGGNASSPINLRFRISGTDQTGAWYQWYAATINSSAITRIGNSGQTGAEIGYTGGSSQSFATVEIGNPSSAGLTFGNNTRQYNNEIAVGGFWFNQTTTPDGFTIYPQAGNITGFVQIHGYND